MTDVIWHVTMSVDGFIAGPGDTMDWAFAHGAATPLAGAVMERTGAILGGRRWHDVAQEHYGGRSGIYGGAWNGPVFVLTHDPPIDPPDPAIVFLSDGIASAVHTALAAADGRDLGLFGASIARQAMAAGLLDELAIHLVPVLLGDGVRLPDVAGLPPIPLERVELAGAAGQTDLRYRVRR